MDISKEGIGRRIRETRLKQGMAQNTLAGKLSIGNKKLSSYENGVAFAPLPVLAESATVFGVTLDWLITGAGVDGPQEIKRTNWPEREERSAPRVGESEACYLKGTVHLTNTELRLLAAFRDIDPGQQSSIIGIAEAFRVANESRENVGGGSGSAVQKSA